MSSPLFDIVRTAHVEYYVTDLQRAKEFYVDTLGFIVTSSTRSQLYLRGVEDRFHHCLLLTKREKAGVGHIAFRVRSGKDLETLSTFLESKNIPVLQIKPASERGLGKGIRAQDPLGFPVEFFEQMQEAKWLHQRFDQHKGARVQRIDHVNLFVSDVNLGSQWYEDLGFQCSEYTEDRKGRLWATWLRRKPTVHDVALMTGNGPRVHHAGFVVAEKDRILDAADLLASKGMLSSIERGPGRHGISNAFFLYLRDPDGHRIELYTGDYLSADPHWKPLKWKLGDPQRQTFWGAPAPESWFTEASKVVSVYTGRLIRPSTLSSRESIRKKALLAH